MDYSLFLKTVPSQELADELSRRIKSSAEDFRKASSVPAGAIVLYGDGIHDDTAALEAWGAFETVVWADGSIVHPFELIRNKAFKISGTLNLGYKGFDDFEGCQFIGDYNKAGAERREGEPFYIDYME